MRNDMTTAQGIPGEPFVRDTLGILDRTYNRTRLLAMIEFSLSFPNGSQLQVSRENPKLKATISAKLLWTAQDRPLTICTNHTPLYDLTQHLVFRRGEEACYGCPGASLRFNWVTPSSYDDNCTGFGPMTIPAISSGATLNMEQDIDMSKILEKTPLDHENPIRIALSPGWFKRTPPPYWAGWGDLETDLKDKFLLYQRYPGLVREGVLSFDADLVEEDEDRNHYLYLEVVFDETEFEVAVVE